MPKHASRDRLSDNNLGASLCTFVVLLGAQVHAYILAIAIDLEASAHCLNTSVLGRRLGDGVSKSLIVANQKLPEVDQPFLGGTTSTSINR